MVLFFPSTRQQDSVGHLPDEKVKTTKYQTDADNKTVTAVDDDSLATTGMDVASVAAVSIVTLMMGVGFIGVERSVRRNDD